MAIEDFIKTKKTNKKSKRYAQVSMDPDFYAKIEKRLMQKGYSWQQVLYASLQQFDSEQ